MSEATIEYKNGPNESTAYVVSEGQKTKVQMVATPAGDLELAESPNVDTGYIVIDGKKHKCALVAEVAGELKLPTSATDDTGYVIAQDGRQHKVKLVANITGGGGGTTINNQDITVTENGTYTADAGYTGLGTVEVQVPNPSTGILSIVENGSYDVTQYATAEVNVPTGGGTTTKYGVSIDNLLGDVDANGNYTARTELFTVDMTQVKQVIGFGYADLPNGGVGHCYNTFSHKFHHCGNLVGTIDLSNLEETSTSNNISFEYAFAITSVDTVYLPKNPTHVVLEYSFSSSSQITDVYIQNTDLNSALKLRYTFQSCKALKNIHGLDKVVSMALYNTFSGTALEGELHFDSLTTMGASNDAFANTKITKLYFPSLTTFSVSSPFGSSKYNSMIQDCTDLVEMHFRADAQATVEALTGYSSKFWGPSTLTIYFDLIGTITVSGVSYSRDEPNSIRVDGNKTFVAWKDASNNIVYTNATSEPAVNTPVYSDAGTTQVGTVSEVA